MKKPQTIWVRNNGDEIFTDRYDGEDFEIAPGESVEMLVECANLCLGFGDEDKTRCFRRKGWSSTKDDEKIARERLDAFSFHMEHPKHGGSPAVHSSAPVGDEALGEAETSPEAVVTPKGKQNLLAKLAQAAS